MTNRDIVEREMQRIIEWADEEKRKLDKKYLKTPGLDTHSDEYRSINLELVRRMQELKKEYGNIASE